MRAYRDGVLVNVLNPKVGLFLFAFLPQFLDPGAAARPQLLGLGGVFFVLALTLDVAYAAGRRRPQHLAAASTSALAPTPPWPGNRQGRHPVIPTAGSRGGSVRPSAAGIAASRR